MALNILQKDTTIKDAIRGKRKRCGCDNSALEKLLAGYSSCYRAIALPLFLLPLQSQFGQNSDHNSVRNNFLCHLY
jgi:hypothetical protein